ncbi:hypothetical protein QYF61_016729 [Mycteria americana]|uniref:Uncharacterized protein n=1 Tax=Mycteria americana TaxID=33587 RepID=A0AAN7S435_MYCAM|nr:hypothetical protein QYF61_016729 [Mycteria americana]
MESSMAEKDLGVLMDTKLKRSQQGALLANTSSGTLGCAGQNIANSWRKVTLPLCSALAMTLPASSLERLVKDQAKIGTRAALGLLLPFLQGMSVPITQWQERAEPLGPLIPK